MKVETYTATIYAGLHDLENDVKGTLEQVHELCQTYVRKKGLCVTVTPTRFIYGHPDEPNLAGWEDGAIVGLINYPRKPTSPMQIKKHAFALATLLKDAFNQNRLSIVFPDETWMLE